MEDLEKIQKFEPNVVKAAWNIFRKNYEYRKKYNEYKKIWVEQELYWLLRQNDPGNWNQLGVWDDNNRMKILNTTQSRRRAQMHVCPWQLDIVERVFNRFSSDRELAYEPFGGLMTVPMTAVIMNRHGYGCELNPD